jgi:hypothetical protein
VGGVRFISEGTGVQVIDDDAQLRQTEEARLWDFAGFYGIDPSETFTVEIPQHTAIRAKGTRHQRSGYKRFLHCDLIQLLHRSPHIGS